MEAVAQQFTDYYYQTFDSNRAGLASLYRDHSMLSFEGQQTQGSAAITEKLVGLPMQNVAHKIETRDAQPGGTDGTSIVVLVTGVLSVDGGSNTLKFSQCFTLNPENGSYYVFNDLFRLNYG